MPLFLIILQLIKNVRLGFKQPDSKNSKIQYPEMSFGWGVGDIMTISGLAVQVYTVYKDAPDDYRNIADEVKSLQIIVNKAARHYPQPEWPAGGSAGIEGLSKGIRGFEFSH